MIKTNKSFGIFTDMWDEDDVTTSIAWGLCGYRGARTGPGKKLRASKEKKRADALIARKSMI